jgi:cytochrome b6
MKLWTKVYDWLDERLDLADLSAPLRHKTVPVHYYSYWYYLGGITLFLFGVQVATGILLLLYYRPSANEAYESVQYITTQVQFGWLIRSIHSWSANLMIFTAFAHMFSVLFLRAYRKPRELTWITGVLLLFLAMGFGFSGYLLPWNTLAFFATKVGTEVAGQVPVIGKWLVIFLRGGEDVTGATLTRFFGFHVALLPGITTLMVAIHLALIQRQGISVPPGMESAGRALAYLRKHDPAAAKFWVEHAGAPPASREMRFFPNFFLRELMAWYAALATLGVLAALYPWGLGVKADPFAPAPAGIKPEWYFLFMFQTLKLIPAKIGFVDGEVIGVLGFGLAGVVWLLLPFLDRSGSERVRAFITGLGVFALIYISTMTVYGHFAK